MKQMTRREFIAVSGASVIAVQAGKTPVQATEPPKPWYTTMRRCGQLNLNERDPLTLDVDAWMDYWQSLRVNAILINGGGIVAFYPTKVPYQHRSEFLGARDLFGELAAAARRRDIRIVARMDCNYAYQEALDAHPEWFERNRDGSPRHQDECPWLFKTCMFSTYFTEQMPAIYREMNARYSPDGYFTNGWPSTGSLEVCYCPACRKIYQEQTGGEPPETTDAQSAAYRKYYEVYMDRVDEVWKLWNRVAQEKNPESVYVGNLGGGIRTVKDLKRLGKVAAWFNADHQGRSTEDPVWICAQQGRVAQSVMDGRTITNVIGSYSTSSPLWRHASKPAAEATLWMAQITASGMVPWYHRLGGTVEDNRWRETGRVFYDWLAANESDFHNQRSLANIAVLYPQSTIAFYRSNGTRERRLNGERIDSTDYLQGLYYALLEGRFLFDFIHQENVTPDALKPYKALLIPNAAYLRDSECQAIQQYVASGGSLLATFETSLYNEWGVRREDFALTDLFGVHAAGDLVGPVRNSYMHLDRPHPIIDVFKSTEILPGTEFRVPVGHLRTESTFLSLIPHYPAYPPEMVYPRIPKTEEPTAVFRQGTGGSGNVVYFPGDIARTAWKSGNPDLNRLIISSVNWLMKNQPRPATVEGQGLMELFAWQTEPGCALHILNYTNPNTMRSFIRRFYPTGPLNVSVRLPEGKTVSAVRALRAGKSLSFKQTNEVVTAEVPSVKDYEVVALRY